MREGVASVASAPAPAPQCGIGLGSAVGHVPCVWAHLCALRDCTDTTQLWLRRWRRRCCVTREAQASVPVPVTVPGPVRRLAEASAASLDALALPVT
jgi:anti-sigma factor RsiW